MLIADSSNKSVSSMILKPTLNSFQQKWSIRLLFFPKCLFFLLVSGLLSGQAQSGTSLDKDSIFMGQCRELLDGMKIAHQGFTPDSNAFAIYAIQHMRDWILMIKDDESVFTYIKWFDSDSIVEASSFIDYSLCQIISQEELKAEKNKNKKSLKVLDFEVQDYYSFKNQGEKLWEEAIRLEYEKKRKFWVFLKKTQELKPPVSQDLKAAQRESEALLKQVTDLEASLQRLEKKLAECQNNPAPDSILAEQSPEVLPLDSHQVLVQEEKEASLPEASKVASDTLSSEKAILAKNEKNTSPTQETLLQAPKALQTESPDKTPLDSLSLLKKRCDELARQYDHLDTLKSKTKDEEKLRRINKMRDSVQILLVENLEIMDQFYQEKIDQEDLSNRQNAKFIEENNGIILLRKKAAQLKKDLEEINQKLLKSESIEVFETLKAERDQKEKELSETLNEEKKLLEAIKVD